MTVIQKLFQSWKMLTFQKSLYKSINVLVTTRKGLGHVFERNKKRSVFHASGYHENCPKNWNLWCQCQKGRLNGTNSYKDKCDLPLYVRTAILPLDDIESCNEGQSCGNWFILGLYDSIAHFNDGSIASLEILKTWKWCQVTTWWRFTNPERVSQDTCSIPDVWTAT